MPVFKPEEVFAGRYLLIQLLGEGGFSEVWKASDQMADEAVVAIKIYAPSKGLDDYGLRQFRNEFSITYNLSHPHLLKVYHYDIVEGSPYLIMPYCPYGSLTNVLREEGVFSEKQVAMVLSQIGSALDEVHRQDPPILHQDIKPDNILLLNPESYMLADFGISSRLRHTIRKATSNMQTLTVAYAPPERFDRHPSSDPSSDIFSLGVTLYEMCTDTVPWDGAGGQCLLKGASIPALPASFSPELNKILEACMSPDKSKRPTAAELHLRGKHFLETGRWLIPKTPQKAGSSGKKLVPLMVAAVVALLAAVGYWVYQEQDWSVEKFTESSKASVAEETTVAPVSAKQDSTAFQLANKLATMEAELLKTNQRLLLQDSINRYLSQNKENVANKQAESVVSPEAASVANTIKLGRQLQRQLNQISDPQHSREQRSGWKQEALAKFANGSVRVLDESDRSLKEYRAGIFLTLLLTSPHQVVVKEIHTDNNNKITSLRISKEPM